MAEEEAAEKNQKSCLNPAAPEFLPVAKQNLRNTCFVHDSNYQNYPPSPYLQTSYYMAPILPHYSFRTNHPYSSSSPTQQQQVVQVQPNHLLLPPATAPPPVSEEPSAAIVAKPPDDEAQAVVQKSRTTDDESVASAARGRRRGNCRHRVSWRRSDQSQRERRFKQQVQWRPEFNDGDFHRLTANLQYTKAVNVKPHQQRYPILPVRKYGNNTTVMIRNIPNRFTREMLMNFLDDHCMEENQKAVLEGESYLSAFDFLYLPIDFKSRMNKGYAFVNFTHPTAVWKFFLAAHDKSWNVFQSNKICKIAYARVQGKEELVKHFRSFDFPCDEYLPVCFSPARDGTRKNVKQSTVGKCRGTSQRLGGVREHASSNQTVTQC